MQTPNRNKVRSYMKQKPKVTQWKLAEYLEINEASLSRIFRYEISPDRAGDLMAAIKELKRMEEVND